MPVSEIAAVRVLLELTVTETETEVTCCNSVLFAVIYLVLAIFPKVRRQVPGNYICLVIFVSILHCCVRISCAYMGLSICLCAQHSEHRLLLHVNAVIHFVGLCM